MPSFGSRKLFYSQDCLVHYLDETPYFGSKSIFLLSRIVSILDLLPKKNDADSGIYIVRTVRLCWINSQMTIVGGSKMRTHGVGPLS